MSTFTEHYDLIKPGSEDYYDVQDFNENMDTIDAQLAEAEAKIQTLNAELDAISERIGTPEAGETIFSLLKAGGTSVIKSIQYKTYAPATSDTDSATIPISPVNLNKTFVIFERLHNYGSYETAQNIQYTLTENSIQVKHYKNSNGAITVGFWIIEFC